MVDVGKLLAAASPAFRAFIGLCAFAGLRLGEAAAVKLDDIDFLRRTLTVRRQVQRANGQQVEIRAQKYGSERTVFLADGLTKVPNTYSHLWPTAEDRTRKAADAMMAAATGKAATGASPAAR